MAHSVGLVRGINVGASTRVAKADLIGAFAACGMRDAVSFLQSGNVVFDADGPPTDADARAVEKELTRRSGVTAGVILLPEDRFRAVAAANPLQGAGDDFSKLMVTFLDHEVPPSVTVPGDADLAPEIVRLGDRAVYQWCPLGVSNSLLGPAFWRTVGPIATGRNWRTVLRLLEELDRRGSASTTDS